MYICEQCKKTYEKLNKKRVSLFDINVCDCGGEITKATNCEKCGKLMPHGYSICLDCATKDYKNLETMLDEGNEWQDDIRLNGFLLYAFSKEDIEQILIDTLKRCDKDAIEQKIERYYNADKDCFWECADKKWKEER